MLESRFMDVTQMTVPTLPREFAGNAFWFTSCLDIAACVSRELYKCAYSLEGRLGREYRSVQCKRWSFFRQKKLKRL